MKTKLVLILSILVVFTSCGNQKNNDNQNQDSTQTDTVIVEKDIVLNPFYNNISNFIAGITIEENSEFFTYTDNSQWKNYASNMDINWDNFLKEKMDIIKPWIKENINDISKNTRDAFYPFSGPDFPYVYNFLPNADNYYLFGLEPVGIIPNVHKIGSNNASFFAAMNNAVRDNLHLSFFITKSMKTQMNNAQIKGTIPVLLYFMVRSELHIQEINPATVNKDGELIITKDTSNNTDKNFSNGVEICFVKKGENKIKKLYYFSMNIRNDGFAANPEHEIFLKSLPSDMTSFVKSSSYCMHEDKYSQIRDIVLNQTKYLIQDDSGVPFRFFDDKKWQFNFFGVYTRPIPVFGHFYQDDYKKAFPTNPISLGFRFGYPAESNIFVTKRK